MSYPNSYFAVGAATGEGEESCVVFVISGDTVLKMPEQTARKLADDILRNANYLWPQEEGTDG